MSGKLGAWTDKLHHSDSGISISVARLTDLPYRELLQVGPALSLVASHVFLTPKTSIKLGDFQLPQNLGVGILSPLNNLFGGSW